MTGIVTRPSSTTAPTRDGLSPNGSAQAAYTRSESAGDDILDWDDNGIVNVMLPVLSAPSNMTAYSFVAGDKGLPVGRAGPFPVSSNITSAFWLNAPGAMESSAPPGSDNRNSFLGYSPMSSLIKEQPGTTTSSNMTKTSDHF